ncbi:hypothetical protein [Nostoc sp.]|uniref:hypothetical protein n=1 Tax=Nostoc sp. TaxID=1180 RepID=UPI002FF5B0E2
MKASLEAAFIDYLVPRFRLGMLMGGLLPQDWRQSRNENDFQPETGNEALKGFGLKLTPMLALPTLQLIYAPQFASIIN